MLKTENFKKVEIESQEQLRNWLRLNYSQEEGIWPVTFKKSEKEKYVSRDEVLDELICFGWIDGIRKKLDNTRTMQLISPRRVQHWAKTYKDRAGKLIKENKMHQSGLDSIKKGKKSGLWNFMDDVDNLEIPDDLKTALNKLEGAFDFFDNINNSSKRFVLRWIKLSKTEKTRNIRIAKIAKLSSISEKLPGS
ncbi:YdeI/OmpD-associated family protein [Bacteroidia bacterium]|nr:YdeI/OmpD-associated family protein [Bacteroidia bacterium]MDC0560456.1 YdeI/OmpD-associated family protein [Bacteroidia bacterium]